MYFRACIWISRARLYLNLFSARLIRRRATVALSRFPLEVTAWYDFLTPRCKPPLALFA